MEIVAPWVHPARPYIAREPYGGSPAAPVQEIHISARSIQLFEPLLVATIGLVEIEPSSLECLEVRNIDAEYPRLRKVFVPHMDGWRIGSGVDGLGTCLLFCKLLMGNEKCISW